ncbi:uncharacterized protein [Acropora muricata]|uniref:uncharacterized protein LOC114966776 n=1 Tax=Acropora millepora TaxID=45264 RepID=UPI001CF50BCA|nr:uncharacterized protein LOC114966776 [Acropora millepora]
MWNVSALSMQQTLICKMTCELAIFFIMIGLHSTHLVVEATPLVIEPELAINCPIVKCSAGYHSDCQSNGQPRCKQCSEGYYSSHPSQTKECLRCSQCGDNEFEVQPCSPTTNVICQKCRECHSPFPFVLKSCTRTSDTICGNCSSALGLECEEEKNPEEHSSRREDREKGNNEQFMPAHHKKRKFQVMEIPAGVRVQPTRPSPITISLPLSFVPTMSVSTSIHSIDNSTRSIRETRIAADPLPQTKKSPTRTFAPFSSPSIKKKEAAVYSETGEKKNTIRNKRWHSKFETRNMTEALKQSSDVSPEPWEPSTATGVIFSSHFEQDKTTTYKFSLRTTSNTVYYALPEPSGSPLWSSPVRIAIFVIPGTVFVLVVFVLLAKVIKRKRCTKRGSRGPFLCQAERGTQHPRCPESREYWIDRQAPRALKSAETDDSVLSSTQNTIISYLSEDIKSVREVFPEDQSMHMWSELQFVTSACDNFDSTGGKLTHPNSDICINIEPGTFPHGKQQPIFFHVVYNDTYVIRDIPETNERTLISPVIKCGPDDINPQKAMEIVVPHCLYVDDVKKGSIAVYRCEQFTDEEPQSWEKIPSSSERSCHSKAWFSIKKDSIIIKTKVFSIWSIFVCGGGGPKRKRVTAFASKPNPETNLISLRCYIYGDNEDSKRKVERIDKERFPGTRTAACEKPFKLFSDNQDINVWLDKNAITEKGWMLDETPASQIYSYEMAYRNGFRSKYACEFSVKPIADCSTQVADFSCLLYFQQTGHTQDFIYVNPGISFLKPPPTLDDKGNSSNGDQTQHSFSETSDTDPSGFVIPEHLRRRYDKPVTEQDCVCICDHIVDWKMLLRHLKVSEGIIRNVDEDYRKTNEKCYQGLLEWKRTRAHEATIRNLCTALWSVRYTEALEKLSSQDVGPTLLDIPETV